MPFGHPARHTISRADELYRGDLFYAGYSPDGRAGVLISHLLKFDLGAPATLQAKGVVNDATGAELPNNATKTYTPATDGTSPLDNANRPATAVIDVAGVDTTVYDLVNPRNVTVAATHATSIVATTIVVSGYDAYNQAMSETLSITATGTSKSAAGKKAFRYIGSIAITAATDSTANTLDVGFGNVFGLPVALPFASNALAPTVDGVADTPTWVVQDQTNPATSTTGDVRGTIAFATAADGTKRFSLVVLVPSQFDTPGGLTAKQAVFGIDQA